jgi:hypothetical protein
MQVTFGITYNIKNESNLNFSHKGYSYTDIPCKCYNVVQNNYLENFYGTIHCISQGSPEKKNQ